MHRVTAVLMLVLALALAPAAGFAKELKPWRGAQAAPPLALNDVQRQRQDLAALRGKLVLVNFWATWCEPCRDEMPSLADLEKRYAPRGLAVVAVNFGDSREKVAAYLKDNGIVLERVLFDTDMGTARRWNARILPASFLIDPAGRIRYSAIGEIDWNAPAVTAIVEKLLPQNSQGKR